MNVLRPRFQFVFLVLLSGSSFASGQPVFQQFADSLNDETLLIEQEGWKLRVETEKSPEIADFLGQRAIVTSPDAQSETVVSATLQLIPNQMWDVGTSLVLEFEAAFEGDDPNSQAMVGIGSTIGGIPPYVGVYSNRIVARQLNYGVVGYATAVEGHRFDVPSGQWIRIRATFTKEHENESPTVSVTASLVDEPGDESNLMFDVDGTPYSDFPVASDAEASLYEYINLLWVRVQGSAAIRDITLAVE